MAPKAKAKAKALPAVPAVANVAANNQLQAMPRGVGSNAVGNAAKRRRVAEGLHLNGTITSTELGQFVAHEHRTVDAIFGSAGGGGGAAPGWFAAAFAAAIAPTNAAVTAVSRGLAANIDAVTAVAANIAGMGAKLDNSRRCARNQASLEVSGITQRPEPVELICKETPGFLALPNAAAPGGAHVPAAVALVLGAAAPPAGAMPPPVFPAVPNTRTRLTSVQIGYYARWYNDTFGILATDTADARMRKFLLFLSGR